MGLITISPVTEMSRFIRAVTRAPRVAGSENEEGFFVSSRDSAMRHARVHVGRKRS